jgi:hypothetical protein
MGVLKRILFWDFPRASWQYDVIVALIIAFVFLTPRDFFGDQPRPASVTMIQGADGKDAFWIEADMLAGVPESDRVQRANALIREKARGRHSVVRVEPVLGSEQELKGYMAFTSK